MHFRSMLVTVGCTLMLAAAAAAQTFSNPTVITIRDENAANPYPGTIAVSGFSGPLEDVTVTLNNLSHTFPSDIVVVLQAPDNRAIFLMSRCGSSVGVINCTLTFSADGPPLPSLLVPGTYRPAICQVDALYPPGPAAASVDLTDLRGMNPNGDWKLWVADRVGGDVGAINGGWSLTLTPATKVSPSSPTAFTYQGVVKENGVPLDGAATARFKLYSAPTGGTRSGPVVVAPITLDRGLFSTLVDFGAAPLDPTVPQYLEVSINGVVQSPRQRMTPAPMATKAAGAPWAGITDVPANVSGAYSPWTPSSFGISYTNGNVGIRTAVAINTLTVNGGGSFSGDLSVGSLVAAPYKLAVTGSAGISGALAVGTLAQLPFTLGVNGDAGKPGGGTWSAFSDSRLKHDIEPMHGTLDRLLTLRGYAFEYNADAIAKGYALPGRQLGLLAEEVEHVFPDWVARDADGYRYVTERSTTALMVEALRDLRAEKDAVAARAEAAEREIDALKAGAAKRDAENAELKARLERLERALGNPAGK